MAYPAIVPCLARMNADGLSRQRWELYVNGVARANCYSEERDAEVVRSYFEREGTEKLAAALVPHAVDPDYWKIFERFPRCSGVAMGLDRLIMSLEGRQSISV
jgi:lysyl-tRNA synthetase class 2